MSVERVRSAIGCTGFRVTTNVAIRLACPVDRGDYRAILVNSALNDTGDSFEHCFDGRETPAEALADEIRLALRSLRMQLSKPGGP